MSFETPWSRAAIQDWALTFDVSIVMPCLNEIESLPHCIANAHEALATLLICHGLTGEIVIADNGSTDGSQACAADLGARVVAVQNKGYGAALIGGCNAAFGRFLLMGDADGSYDFNEGVAMVEALNGGADLCMGSRFHGGIAPGAMPWKNRYIGNPALTAILNLFFRSGIDDAHCGLRAITRSAFLSLGLKGSGMEFASEMVIKASLKSLKIMQVPATLSRDLRNRQPHLRPWRDGWRHLRYLLMLSPNWMFGLPAILAMSLATIILGVALCMFVGVIPGPARFGTSWTIVAGFLFTTGHLAAIMAVATHLHGVREGYRRPQNVLKRYRHFLTLESMLVLGLTKITFASGGLLAIGYYWSQSSFAALPTILPLVLTAVLGATGLQWIFGGFLLSIISGHDARIADAIAFSSEKEFGEKVMDKAA
ncbi:family 2 glycosyl transferase [Sphingobium sp. SCG-1]|uniref:glycosyltransferase family 2 protein n=1 Tax=Sphingobium sp. SCG-1 TaxID=2072936 RepID=UPI000CD6B503|nr:glycosyltransferase family 2 protein [Sphingobium sp. SCG-1]AUW58122.1 family 2 glycosyl transferase [Sphingobium sp. SCG-1]